MNKNEFICNLNAEINNGEALLDRFERFQEYHDDLGTLVQVIDINIILLKRKS